ncbi:MAG TPA: hypothetical protein VMI34_16940 [Candidatus Bathyarchaeia archaeon]|nr:hypothetical protein [Candidatus Bathyarchaeia archaeon]
MSFRALLALLLGLTSLMMVILAIALPRTTTIIIVQVFAGFALLDGLLCLGGALRPMPASARGLIALEGVVEVVVGLAAFSLASDLDERVSGVQTLVSAWAVLTGLLELGWVYTVNISRGRILLVIAALLSIAFGVLIFLVRAPDVMTAIWRFAVYILLLGVLRTLVAVGARAR